MGALPCAWLARSSPDARACVRESNLQGPEGSHVFTRDGALPRDAEILLRHVYQHGGRDRFVLVEEIEEDLGLEEELILELCRKRLLGGIQVADRLPAELEDTAEGRTPLERQWIRDVFSRPHVRIRPGAVRLTEEELLEGKEKRKKKKKKRRRKKQA